MVDLINVSTAPYFDDYDETKDYYKILFKPSVSVQTRELNQLQTMLQKQIERFGDNIFVSGTIVDGCQLSFYDNIPYIKILDTDVDGNAVDVQNLVNKVAISETTGLAGIITKAINGYENGDGDPKTIYIKYINSGNDSNTTTYANNEVLTVSDINKSIFSLNIINGGSGFSNTDQVVFMGQLEVQNTSGGILHSNGTPLETIFTNESNTIITQATTGAQAKLIAVSANTQSVLLKVAPLANNLANSANSSAWAFYPSYTITTTAGTTANVVNIVGVGATASIVTDGAGVIVNTNILSAGGGYDVLPSVSIAASNNSGNTTQINLVDISPKNYLQKIKVGAFANNSGVGYGMSISNGVIYQSGYFSRVSPQTLIVSKYNSSPNNVVVGMSTEHLVVNSNIDSTLLDNVTGHLNQYAVGADRLKLEPVLVVMSKDESNSNNNFLPIVEFNDGQAAIINDTTVYNKIEEEIQKRTYEESGNYVVEEFNLTTKSKSLMTEDSNKFSVYVGQGLAYINGKRFKTNSNYLIDVDKGISTKTTIGQNVDINYGNYYNVNNVGGIFKFSVGDLVDIYDAAAQYTLNNAGNSITSVGNKIGTARLRSFIKTSGADGSPNATYKLYIFDEQWVSGANPRNAKSLYYNGTNKGIADIILDSDGTTGNLIAQIKDTGTSKLIYKIGVDAVKTLKANTNSANVVYTTKTSANNSLLTNNGSIVIVLSGNEYFPYLGSLTDSQKSDISIIPLSNTKSSNAAGSVTVTAGSNVVIGTSTLFTSNFRVGDYVSVINTTASQLAYITSIANNTYLTTQKTFANTQTSNCALTFPQNIMIPFDDRSNRTAIVTSNTTLTINIGSTLTTNAVCAVYYNKNVQASSNNVAKIANRSCFVKIKTSNNVSNTVGSWCLGVSDIFRLKNVYVANTTNVNTTSTNVTNYFYVDHNQNENYYGLGYLYLKNNIDYTLESTDCLLVELDILQKTQDGLVTIDSYPLNDTKSLDEMNALGNNSVMNTMEIPEMFSSSGTYYDMRDVIDFRPSTSNTAILTSNSSLATINPVEPLEASRFNTTSEKYFPLPQSDVTFDVVNYLGRNDRIIASKTNGFVVLNGTYGSNTAPTEPSDSITINVINVPPYPSIPAVLSSNTSLIYNTGMFSERALIKRKSDYSIKSTLDENDITVEQPKAYNMADIGSIDRRVKALEYYVALNESEKEISKKIIPSSSNNSIDRFKFGFFVDNFSNSDFSDVNNAEYSATVVDGKLMAKQDMTLLPYSFYNSNSTFVSLAYTEYNLISQNDATDGSVSTIDVIPSPVSNNNTIETPPSTTVPSTTPSVDPIPSAPFDVRKTSTAFGFENSVAYSEIISNFVDAGSGITNYSILGNLPPNSTITYDAGNSGNIYLNGNTTIDNTYSCVITFVTPQGNDSIAVVSTVSGIAQTVPSTVAPFDVRQSSLTRSYVATVAASDVISEFVDAGSGISGITISGSLPNGLNIFYDQGVSNGSITVAGTPQVSGSTNCVVTFTSSNGSDTLNLSCVVATAPSTITINSTPISISNNTSSSNSGDCVDCSITDIYSAYVDKYADLSAAYATDYRVMTWAKTKFGQFHWSTYGQNEGRTLPKCCPSVTVVEQLNHNYNGIFTSISPPNFIMSPSNIQSFGGFYYRNIWKSYHKISQTFEYRISGLKPQTEHKFYFDGEDKTSSCEGSKLISGSDGTLIVKFYFVSETTKAQSSTNAIFDNFVGSHQIKIINSSGDSVASTTMSFSNQNTIYSGTATSGNLIEDKLLDINSLSF